MPITAGSFLSMPRRLASLMFGIVCLGLGFGLIPYPAQAQLADAVQNTQLTAEAAGVSANTDLVTIIGRIIYIFLGLLGIIFLVLLLYAGFLWMTAAGDAEKVKKAQSTIRNAVIGLLIIVSSFAITAFILKALTGDQGGGAFSPPKKGPKGFLAGAVGSLGGAIIESHYPGPNATGVVRNTAIIITFKEPIKPESFIDGWTPATSNTVDGLNVANIKIYRTSSGAATALSSDKVHVKYTQDFKTYVMKPLYPPGLGSPTEKVGYTVTLTGGQNGIVKIKNNEPAFGGAFGKGYYWQFETSTIVDLTPPKLISAIPQKGGEYSRNIIVQMTFNEAIDPTAATGKVPGTFQNIEVMSGEQNQLAVSGEFKISNQYRTIEFLPVESCGTNSCGNSIFCLPGPQTIQTNIKAANLDPKNIPQALFTNNGYDGVVDVAGNSFDGNGDTIAQGPLGSPPDNYTWTFKTSNDINLSAPKVKMTIPSSDPQLGENSNVPLDQSVVVKFDSLLQASTITTDNAKIEAHGKDEKDPDTFWWFVGMKLLNSNGVDIDPAKDIATQAAIVIDHRVYLPSGDGSKDVKQLNLYDPYILSNVQSVYQNCFNPAAWCGQNKADAKPNCCNFKDSGETKCKDVLLHP